MKRKKVSLVKDWKHCKKWLSVRLSALGSVFMASWLMLDKLKEYVPPQWLAVVAMALFILIPVTRIINQGANERDDKSNSEPS